MKQSTRDRLIHFILIGLATVLLGVAGFIWYVYRQIEPIL